MRRAAAAQSGAPQGGAAAAACSCCCWSLVAFIFEVKGQEGRVAVVSRVQT